MLQQLLHFCFTGFASNHILKSFKCSDAQWNTSSFILQKRINKTDKNVPDKSGFYWYTDNIQEILLYFGNLTPFKGDLCQLCMPEILVWIYYTPPNHFSLWGAEGMWNNFKNNLRNSPVSHRETISAISWGKDGQKLPLRFFFFKGTWG